jgi:hypothetical protein
MSNPTSTRPQPSVNGSAISKQASPVYSSEQQAKLLNLQGEVDLLLAQIQAETKFVAAH